MRLSMLQLLLTSSPLQLRCEGGAPLLPALPSCFRNELAASADLVCAGYPPAPVMG